MQNEQPDFSSMARDVAADMNHFSSRIADLSDALKLLEMTVLDAMAKVAIERGAKAGVAIMSSGQELPMSLRRLETATAALGACAKSFRRNLQCLDYHYGEEA